MTDHNYVTLDLEDAEPLHQLISIQAKVQSDLCLCPGKRRAIHLPMQHTYTCPFSYEHQKCFEINIMLCYLFCMHAR